MDVPAIENVGADTDEAAAAYRPALELVGIRVARVEAVLAEWCGSALPELLEDAHRPT